MSASPEEFSGGFQAPSPDEITRCAYQIYLAEGCPEGRGFEHWLEAERQLTICALHDAVRKAEKLE